ncbi:MAG: helix-turn-helix domain-containing protein [Bacilli bacterium]
MIRVGLGEISKRQRKLLGKTRYDIAKSMNVSVETIKKIEEGSYQQHVNFIKRYCCTLGFSVHELFKTEESRFEE